jgi:hypothetical protein
VILSQKTANPSLLCEGGLAGHMYHLYDDPELTFGELKAIFISAATGRLRGTEKIDGQNLYISYSLRHSTARAARNKTEAVNGGLTKEQIRDKFEGREELQNSFYNALVSFENVISKIDPETIFKVFGPNAKVFYNCEIQTPSVPNVIRYDSNNVVIHTSGHLQIDQIAKVVNTFDATQPIRDLEVALRSNEKRSEGVSEDFLVRVNPITKLPPVASGKVLNVGLMELSRLQSSYGLTDQDPIGKFIVNRIAKFLNSVNVPEYAQEDIIKLISTGKGSRRKALANAKPAGAGVYSTVVKILSESNSYLKKAIAPLEMIIHEFSVECLKGFKSAFINNPEREAQRLKDSVRRAIELLQTSNSIAAQQLLAVQMKKLKDVENIQTPVEGFVFTHAGKSYKLTGNFAPANQILGILKYGKGNVAPIDIEPNMRLSEDGAEDERVDIALYPGKFKPPHAGHYNTALLMLNSAKNVTIVISGKEYQGLTAEQSKAVWQLFLSNSPHKDNINVLYTTEEEGYSPVNKVYDIVTNADETISFGVVVGEKDAEDGRFKKLLQDPTVNVKQLVVPPQSGGISATDIRNILAKGDKNNFLSHLPSHLNEQSKEAIWEILNNMKDLKDELKEMSAMGAGAVSGTPGGPKMGNTIKRKEFLESLKPKAAINESLKMKIFESVKRKLNESEIPHQSTGINVLSDLLKKIVPVIEIDYKSLTTDFAQRKSYRSHILSACTKALAPQKAANKISIKGEPEVGLSENDEQEASGEVSGVSTPPEQKLTTPEDENKFIDVGLKADEPEEEEEDDFTIPGEDVTGRNVAIKTMTKIEKNILDSYSVLSNQKDQDLFYDYLLTNLKLYFDKFEDQLQSSAGADTEQPPEPSTSGAPGVADNLSI